MAKNKKKKKKDTHDRHDADVQVVVSPTEGREAETGPTPKMKRKEYERQMRILHGELVAMQEWVKDSGAKVCVVFEGRDTEPAGVPGRGPDDKKRARLNVISHLLSQVPYKPLAHRDITLPRRQPPGRYVQPDLSLRHIPTPF